MSHFLPPAYIVGVEGPALVAVPRNTSGITRYELAADYASSRLALTGEAARFASYALRQS